MSYKNRVLASASIGALVATGLSMAAAQTAQQSAEAATKTEMKNADKDMGLVLQKLQSLGAKPLSTLSVEQARSQPTPADAVKAVLKDEGKYPEQLMAAMKVAKKDLTYPTAGGTQPIRIYTPEGTPPQGGFPVVVYIHGGGWVIANIDVYESSPMAMAKKANAVVASIEYRHAPESKFPAAHDDAIAAYKWVLENAASWNGDPQKVALVGESAGGNLAINVAIAARDQKFALPLSIVADYPVAGVDTNTPSYQKHAQAAPLGKADMEWFFDKVLSKPDDKQDARLDLVGKANLKGLPPTTVITAEIDPLMSEGKSLAEKLKQAGVKTTYENFDGVSHEFFGMGAVVKDADRAEEMAVKELKAAFSTIRPK
jgi:acetyl esterase